MKKPEKEKPQEPCFGETSARAAGRKIEKIILGKESTRTPPTVYLGKTARKNYDTIAKPLTTCVLGGATCRRTSQAPPGGDRGRPPPSPSAPGTPRCSASSDPPPMLAAVPRAFQQTGEHHRGTSGEGRRQAVTRKRLQRERRCFRAMLFATDTGRSETLPPCCKNTVGWNQNKAI